MKGFVTTKNLKKAIRHIEKDHKFQLNEEIEVYHKNGKVCYGIVEISHFHICPTLVMIVKKIEVK